LGAYSTTTVPGTYTGPKTANDPKEIVKQIHKNDDVAKSIHSHGTSERQPARYQVSMMESILWHTIIT